jgi:hypothetical protein
VNRVLFYARVGRLGITTTMERRQYGEKSFPLGEGYPPPAIVMKTHIMYGIPENLWSSANAEPNAGWR